MEKKRQILIILWKWSNLGEGVNGPVFKKRKLETHFNNIQLGKEGKHKYFNELAVEHSEQCPNAVLVQVNIYKDNADTERLLHRILEEYVDPKNEILFLLHRAHQFNENGVQSIISSFGNNNIKCFLFADGRDFIYYNTQKSGLLNDVGGFFIQRDEWTGEYVETFNETTQKVNQPFFDRVWIHYHDEFQKKVFELKEELFSSWIELLLPGQPEVIDSEILLEKLQRWPERALKFRVKSFLGAYKVLNDKKTVTDPVKKGVLLEELKKVEKLEKFEGKSYLFDAALATIDAKQHAFIKEKYNNASSLLANLLFDGRKKPITKEDLKNLQEKFNELIQVIPGEYQIN